MTTLQVGDKAPPFKSIDQYGIPIKLSDFKGKKIVLFFYPKDNTPGCTAEACNLKDNYPVLEKNGYVILGVSINSEKSHLTFSNKYQLPYRIIVDEQKKIVNDYKVWGRKKMMGREYDGTFRTTFLISKTGKIEHIITQVNTKDHTAQILELWKKT